MDQKKASKKFSLTSVEQNPMSCLNVLLMMYNSKFCVGNMSCIFNILDGAQGVDVEK